MLLACIRHGLDAYCWSINGESPFLSSLESQRLRNDDFRTSAIEALEAFPHLSTLQAMEPGARDADEISNPVFRRLAKRLGSDFDNAVDEEE